MKTLLLIFLAWCAASTAVYYAFPNRWVMVGFAFFSLMAFLVVAIIRSREAPQ